MGAGLGGRGTAKSQFYSPATQSVEKPCILLDSHSGRGRGTAEELQLTMGKEEVFPFSASASQRLSLEGENGALPVAVHAWVARSQWAPQESRPACVLVAAGLIGSRLSVHEQRELAVNA